MFVIDSHGEKGGGLAGERGSDAQEGFDACHVLVLVLPAQAKRY